MNANELRIGNLVECDALRDTYKDRIPYFGNHIHAVHSACVDFVKLELGDEAIQKVEIFAVKPIPLTKEWLLKLGFKKRFDFDDCNLYDLVEYTGITKSGLNRGQGFFCLADFVEKEGFWIDLQSRATLKYVHQLQNLFSAITGVELQLSST